MANTRFADQLKALPGRPGVYIMRNEAGQVIYVGKAASLRNRVRSYFGSPWGMEPKTRKLVENIADFEHIVTNSAQEALVLEATLIKRHQPYFNIRLKDDKHYPYLKVDLTDPFPRVYITRRVEKDGGRYFGPYASAGSIRMTMDLIKRLFPYRSCTKIITGTDPRPCLEYYINRCIAPCTAYCSKEEYDEVIQQVIKFLEGKTEEVVDELTARMNEAAEAFDYERAALFRDRIQAVRRVSERQMMATTRPADMDVFGLARNDDEACVQVFFVRGTKVVGRDHFVLQGTREETDGRVLASFLQQFYASALHVPRDVLLPSPPEEVELISAWLGTQRGTGVRITAPSRGEKRRLVKLAGDNARETLDMIRVKRLSDQGKTQAALEELQDQLDLPDIPHRIECYDISNTQGTNSVASMVVFIDGRPRPPEYRRFKIKTVEGANDFASMAEVLERRFKRAADAVAAGEPDPKSASWAAMPDLLIVDGGKGQLGAALDVMRNLGLSSVPTAGLAKENEELFMAEIDGPIVLPRNSQGLYLVQRIRDEAHRFAITFHRQLRGKRGIQSTLDEVEGIGPKRKRALIRKFGSVRAIREAEPDDIAATPG
ncbi:MAG TPA: excinuclease ABC subunit UvrC, partial [Dehalococcoidia bacterium]|nr:excinuclease ABC subunit UvrC [Dehalococcoidia bacterium]